MNEEKPGRCDSPLRAHEKRHEKRRIDMKRDVYASTEAYVHEKRRVYVKIDVYTREKMYIHEKRRIYMKRDVYT